MTSCDRVAKNRKQTEMFESLVPLKKVRAKALLVTRFDKWVIVDSNKPVAEVASELETNLFASGKA